MERSCVAGARRWARGVRDGCLAGGLIAWLGLAAPLSAHAPHDTVEIVALSPDFATDGTAFIEGRLTDRLFVGKTTDFGKSWTILRANPAGHFVTDLELSPDWTADQTLFAATLDAGVWRSTDGGLTWQGSTAGLIHPRVDDLAVSPDFEVDQTVLAATPAGLFRSIDGGVSFSLVDTGLVETVITSVAYAPGAPGVVYAGRLTLHRSNDAAGSFAPLSALPAPLEDLAISPAFATDGSLALCFGRFLNGVLRSDDEGATLEPVTAGLIDLRVNDVDIAADGTLFCVNYGGGCQRLAPGASTWEHLDEGWEDLSDLTENHSVSVAISPDFANDGVVYVGSYEGLFITDEGGDAWHQSDVYSQRLSKQLVFSPAFADDGLVFMGNYGGGPFAWRESGLGPVVDGPAGAGGGVRPSGAAGGGGAGAGGGVTGAVGTALPAGSSGPPELPGPGWSHLGTDIGTLWSSVLMVSPSFATDRTLYSAYNGLYRSKDGGHHWSLLPNPVPTPRVLTLVPDYPAEPTMFLGSSGQGSFRSDDDGATWAPVGGGLSPEALTTTITVSPGWPGDPRLFWGTQNEGLWRSSDGGASFELVTPPGLKLRGVALSPEFVADGIILAATNGSGLLRSDDGGDTWTTVNTGLPSGDDNVIESVVCSPDFGVDQTAFLASMYDGVFKSTDGGITWQPVGPGLNESAPRTLAISPAYGADQTVWLTSFDWVWRSVDGGANWSQVPGDMRVNDHHPAAGGDDHSGQWSGMAQPGNYGVSVQASNVAGATKAYTFRGDRITWYAQRDNQSGFVDVFLDGVKLGRYDLWSPITLPQQAILSRSFPTVDWHEIVIEVVGQANPASRGTWVKTDGFRLRF